MDGRFDSDTAVYVTTGAFCVVVFAVGMAVLTITAGTRPGSRAFWGFTGGFLVFVAVYFVSMGSYRLLSNEP